MGKNENMEMKRILDILKSKKILIAFILIVFTLLGYFYSYHYVIPKYKSEATLLLIPNTISDSRTITNLELSINSELITTYSNIAQNPKVLKQTISNLGLEMTEEQLLNSMRVNAIEDTYIIEVSVSNTDAQKAMDITNELSKVFLNEIKNIYDLNNIGVVDEAQLAKQPYNVNHTKDIILFLGAGMIASMACIMFIYLFENTLKREEDIENYIKIKSLGNIPMYPNKKQEIIDADDGKSYITECINTIRTNILYMNSAKDAKSILVTSCTPQEGKSWVSANIAVSFAKINKKVLLIDADMRKGRAHRIFEVNNTEGLANYLHTMTGNVKNDTKLGKKYIKETKIPNLHILTNGSVPPNPSELIDSSNMKELMAILQNIYDVVIVDAPPCKLVTDSIILSTIIDSTILVVNAEKTKINDLNEVKKSIQAVGGDIIGAILNKKKIAGRIYRKNYYYGHTEQKETEETKKRKILPVNKVIEESIPELEKIDFNVSLKEEEAEDKIEESKIEISKDDDNKTSMKQFMKKQHEYLEKMVNTVSDMKLQLDGDSIQEQLEKRSNENKIAEMISTKLEELRQENKKIDYTEELNKISKQLEEVKQNNFTSEEMKEIVRKEIAKLEEMKQEEKEIDYSEELNKILGQIEEVKQSNFTSEEMKEIIRKEIEKLEENKEEKLTKEQIENIIKQEISNMDYTQDMEKIYQQIEDTKINTSEMIKEMADHNKEELLNTLRNRENGEQQMQRLINEKITQMQEEMQKMLEEEMTKMNYTQQIVQINDILTDLKDSYLELSNRMKANSMENEKINYENIIDMKAFKTHKNKKGEYSIEEEIPYEELEKSATYIIPVQRRKANNSSGETYKSTMW